MAFSVLSTVHGRLGTTGVLSTTQGHLSAAEDNANKETVDNDNKEDNFGDDTDGDIADKVNVGDGRVDEKDNTDSDSGGEDAGNEQDEASTVT